MLRYLGEVCLFMKIIHTADWHLGKIVNNVHMTDDQRHILERFIEVVKEEKPDAIIVAGDLYDRAIPPKEAVTLLNDIFNEIVHELNIPLLAITGNHDSPNRMEFGSKLFQKNQLFLKARLEDGLEPVIIHDEYGPVNFHLIPYIEPAEAAAYFEEEIKSHHSAMEKVIEHIMTTNNPEERHVFVGHAFLAGGMESESEERLTMLGGTPYIDASLFTRFSYVALGHLHQPQKVKQDYIRYSGSILKYSFSEANHRKSVTVVELDEAGTCQLTLRPLEPKHDMRIVEGYMNDLVNMEHSDDYLHIRLLDDGQIIDPMGKLRKVFPNILRLERKSFTTKTSLKDLAKVKERQQMSHLDLFASFYEEMKGNTLSDERKDYVARVVEELMTKERGQ